MKTLQIASKIMAHTLTGAVGWLVIQFFIVPLLQKGSLQ
jgi:hypothetical protein